jgi:hypothetical protein
MKKSGAFAVCVHTTKDFWSLCRVHTHGKSATWSSPVLLGAPGWCAGKAFAMRASMWAHGKASFTAYFCRTATTKRTATSPRTAKTNPHGKLGAHGKEDAARQPSARTAKGFAVRIVHAHGNVHVAVGSFAGRSLSCVHARQCLCRAYRGLCRAK